MTLFGAVEAGGTKFVCAVGSNPEDLTSVRIPTTTPQETLGRCLEFFRAQAGIAALGIGSFGPLELRRGAAGYGRITSTPKPGWQNTDLVGTFQRELGVPVGFDTDVNAAVLGEARWGAAQGLDTVVYVTVGTGIGGGALIGGRLMHGLLHPEMGHLLLPREPDDRDFGGSCPFHGADCWEGVASGPALGLRVGGSAEGLPSDHPLWDLEARYVASALATLVLVLSPERLILGGGVMQVPGLLERTRGLLLRRLSGYVRAEAVLERSEEYVVAPGLGERSGIVGALGLAEAASSAQLS
jgi:fructokinase